MKKTTILLMVLLALVSVGAFAQPGPPENPADDPTTGDGGGGLCYTCIGYGDYYWCQGVSTSSGSGNTAWASGFSQCHAYQSYFFTGVAWCEVSGVCMYRLGANKSGGDADELSTEQQTEKITEYFQDSGVLSAAELCDFIAETDFALRDVTSYRTATHRRLDAYRAKFATLSGQQLRPGGVPISPHRPIKAPAATIAAR